MRYRAGVDPRDRYGRLLAYVWLPDGRLFNGLLVERGYAVPLAVAPNLELAPRFRAGARRARRAGRGLWSRRACGGDPDRPLSADAAARSATDRARSGGSTARRDRDCGDFTGRARAQRYFEARGGRPGRDVDALDADGDGRVCESLP